ncbi:uncharacterized protein THITE_159723 [Thermothielavioides terrestris NRRL 8126]|uniref:Uncharacterized protein n=1 Tax=Thermothielavioides terrestris (strain ATCC 38088 / NRRL 8126) TaxID=578455 RepID=G2RGX4_THETT|nr:uncharacterized protein THITE_159723 [Thermothielavioides terrestris NRRL 8126]AEO71959.1 hypothetical protein THITE_159723 [Thermothielavioides terrestris NRRL 8126]
MVADIMMARAPSRFPPTCTTPPHDAAPQLPHFSHTTSSLTATSSTDPRCRAPNPTSHSSSGPVPSASCPAMVRLNAPSYQDPAIPYRNLAVAVSVRVWGEGVVLDDALLVEEASP